MSPVLRARAAAQASQKIRMPAAETRGESRASQGKADVHVAGGDGSCGVMGHRLGSTNVLASAAHGRLPAPRCHALKTAWSRGSDPCIFTYPPAPWPRRDVAHRRGPMWLTGLFPFPKKRIPYVSVYPAPSPERVHSRAVLSNRVPSPRSRDMGAGPQSPVV